MDFLKVQRYANDGVVCLKNFLPISVVDSLRKGIALNLQDPSPYGRKKLDEEEQNGGFVDDYGQAFKNQISYTHARTHTHTPLIHHDPGNWSRFQEFESFVKDERVGRACGKLMKSKTVRLFSFVGCSNVHSNGFFRADFTTTTCLLKKHLARSPLYPPLLRLQKRLLR